MLRVETPVSIARGWGYQRIPVAADLRRLLALPDRSAPPPRSPSSSSSASSPDTIASAVAASDFDDSEGHDFHAQLERLGAYWDSRGCCMWTWSKVWMPMIETET
ncbi:hypothetical protein GQ600_5512 [Phytophthora cactorum]|nr:hypothetical protein GQ600_5512 [Phytophthora cactorum]